ncbi:hypothetical protein GCM10007385_46950 [Tateyamaria omphalii]|uniref:hypothetical protein n=1 Tax=Tateyamaria omphalii TaxID=299262 RepID=UPI00167B1EF2|nr:hypothetical protein [Tateyamaria omphalii]GGX72768.1 hypothetical protein GCM10007385_46950 [Tateyamaria omphalii]
MTDKAEAAVRIYTGVEKRILAGDLKALKEAAGSPEQVNLLVEVYNCALPPNTPLTEDQQRFRNALISVRDEINKQNKADTVSEVEALPPALPHTRLVLERMREDRTASQLNSAAERSAFLDEIEEVEQLRLALAYYQQTDVEIPNHALRSVVDRLVDVEEPETDSHRDRGPIH